MASTIQIRVDDDLKSKSDQLFKDLGTDTTSAIRMFLTQAVAYNGFPFEIKRTSVSLHDDRGDLLRIRLVRVLLEHPNEFLIRNLS